MGPAKFLLNIYGTVEDQDICVALRGQLTRGVNSLPPLFGSQGSNSGHHSWGPAPLSSIPSCWPQHFFTKRSHFLKVTFRLCCICLPSCNFREQAIYSKYDQHTYCNLKSNHETFENPKEHVLWIQEDGFGFNHKNQSGSPHRTILSPQLQHRSKQRLKQSTLFHTKHPPGPELQAAMRCLKWVLGTNSHLLKEQHTLKSLNHLSSSERKKLRLCDSLPVFFYAR